MSNSKEKENKLTSILLRAIEEKDIKKMRELIATDTDINGVGMITHYYWEGPHDSPEFKSYDTFHKPLEYAFQQKFLEGFELLLQKGADPNKLILGKFISSEGDKVNMDENVNNFLHEACNRQDIPFVDVLLKYGADVNIKNKYGKTPLSIVASNGYYTDIKEHNNKADYEIALKLIKAGADIDNKDDKGRTPLMEATLRSKGKLIEKLIELGADVNAEDKDGNTVISNANNAYIFKDKIFNILLDAGAKLEGEKGFRTFCEALRKNGISTPTIKKILGQGVALDNKNCRCRTPLMSAVSYKNLEIINMFIEAGADVNAKDEDGKTPLHCAMFPGAEKKMILVVKTLIDAGADVNAQDKKGMTPLMTAASYGMKDMFMFLRNAGAKLDIKDRVGKTAYDHAYDYHGDDMGAFLRSVALNEKVRKKVVEDRMKKEDELNIGNTGERKRLPKMTNLEKIKAMRKAKKELLK